MYLAIYLITFIIIFFPFFKSTVSLESVLGGKKWAESNSDLVIMVYTIIKFESILIIMW